MNQRFGKFIQRKFLSGFQGRGKPSPTTSEASARVEKERDAGYDPNRIVKAPDVLAGNAAYDQPADRLADETRRVGVVNKAMPRDDLYHKAGVAKTGKRRRGFREVRVDPSLSPAKALEIFSAGDMMRFSGAAKDALSTSGYDAMRGMSKSHMTTKDGFVARPREEGPSATAPLAAAPAPEEPVMPSADAAPGASLFPTSVRVRAFGPSPSPVSPPPLPTSGNPPEVSPLDSVDQQSRAQAGSPLGAFSSAQGAQMTPHGSTADKGGDVVAAPAGGAPSDSISSKKPATTIGVGIPPQATREEENQNDKEPVRFGL